ncbi:MAG: polyprenyl synthetase family protein [Pseudomonadota bacterium]
MDSPDRLERALEAAISLANHEDCPPQLTEALAYAVFPGGARVRPKLTLSVATACNASDSALVDCAAAAVELLHCASLVHDDLPCFDAAATRRGKPSLHVTYDERIAVLAGDALIVLAFEMLARSAGFHPERLPVMVRLLAEAASVPRGIAAGQAWECEESVPLTRYQRQKTGALFIAATTLGAAAAGADPEPWVRVGERLGEAYQVADDILDVSADPEEIGKPVGVDSANSRPNSVLVRGMSASERLLRERVAEAVEAIPACAGQAALKTLIAGEAQHFMALALHRSAAA